MALQKKQIAVVCANLPDRNTGMVTVDLAAHSVLRQNFPDAEITLYCFERGHAIPYADGEIAHSYLDIVQHADKFLASDLFLYWGDFIHSHSYWELDMNLFLNDEFKDFSTDEKLAAVQEQHSNRSKCIFLAGQSPETIKKAVVFGSTIITNEAFDAHDKLYTSDFNAFFAHAGSVFFRDALSAAKISPFRDSEATLASDCALLLQNEDLKQLDGFTQASTRSGVGVFFGRSPSKLKMLIFSKIIGKILGEKCTWLPWFPSSKKMRVVGKLFGYQIPESDVQPGHILSALSGYRFIVTDTYHICVNAWRMGIPAVCIGQGSCGALSSLADKKKEILFEMYGARRLYVFLERIATPKAMWREAKLACVALKDTVLTSGVAQNIQDHRAMALKRLVTAMNKILT